MNTNAPTIRPFFLRRRETAGALGVSESLVLIFERRGLLTPIRMPGVKAVRHALEEVEHLARKIRAGEVR